MSYQRATLHSRSHLQTYPIQQPLSSCWKTISLSSTSKATSKRIEIDAGALLFNDHCFIVFRYPLFESLHTLDLHESAITFCDYITEPNNSFYQHLLRLQSKQARKDTYSLQVSFHVPSALTLHSCLSTKGESHIRGSIWFDYFRLQRTDSHRVHILSLLLSPTRRCTSSHADGSIKFWDASGCNLVFLYKIRTYRLLDRIQSGTSTLSASPPAAAAAFSSTRESNANVKFDTKSTRANSNSNDEQQQISSNDDNPFSIYSIKLCCDGKYLIAAGRGGHVTLFKFTGSELDKADEGLGDLSSLEIPIFHRNLSSNQEDFPASANNSMINEIQSTALRQHAEKKVEGSTSVAQHTMDLA